MSQLSIGDYTVGWICALQEEYEAACRMLDDELDGPETSEVNDNNTYVFGCVSGHNLVIGCLPEGRYGTSSAASVAKDMVRSFPNLRFALMVGIGGGAPTRERDIRLGDVVVSVPHGKLGGVIQYDFGKRLSDGRFEQTSQLNAPPEVLLGVIPEMRRQQNDPKKPDRISENLRLMEDMPGYQRPADDRLYRADYNHKGGKNCVNCEDKGLEKRPPRKPSREVTVHYGIIASANSVMKNATERDLYAKELNVLCFEMEAGGLMNNFPCLVIRGICDYSDSHKNDEWHKYAALTAAAYAREFLHVLKPRKVAVLAAWAGEMEILLAGIQKGVSDISRKTDDIIHYQYSQEKEKFLKWLTQVDYTLQQNENIKRRQPGTGQWVLDSTEFRQWQKPYGQTLFCHGFPGAGKTVITSIIIDHLQANYQNHSDQSRYNQSYKVGIAFVYCDSQQWDQQKPVDILASLVKQLIPEQPCLPKSVKSLYSGHKNIPSSLCPIDVFSKALQSVISEYTGVFIVIDALDECQDHGTLISEFFDLQAQTGANLLITSRPNQEIESACRDKFKGYGSLEISARNEDVGKYLDGHMSQLPLLDEKNEDLSKETKIEIKTEIRTRIISAANGVFLLARFHLESLIDKTTPNEVTTALETLPKGEGALDEAYGKTIKRIRNQRQRLRLLAANVLSLLACAKRLLTTLELRHALAVKAGISTFNENTLESTSIIVAVCAGLVAVDKDSGTIRLLHDTTREYLKTHMFCITPREDPTTLEDPTMFDAQKNDIAMAKFQRTITIICVTYLSFDVFEGGFCQTDKEFEERLRSNRFYDYAAHNWGHHAREAITSCQEVTEFLKCEAKVEASSQALMVAKWYTSLPNYSQRVPRQITGLHLAAYFGVQGAVHTVLGKYLDSTDSYRWTPLLYAVEKGHEAVVKQLLEAGADVNAETKDGQTALQWAVEKGHEAVVQLLLKFKADVNAKTKVGWIALLWAAKKGHEAVVQLLLEAGADVNAETKDGQTALQWAAGNGHKVVVQLLLRFKADVNTMDNNGKTALHQATKNGQEAVVKQLLEAGADANAKTKGKWTALRWAAEKGHEAVVQLLLKFKADINTKDNNKKTALHQAAKNGHDAVVQLLLAARANVNATDNNRDTALLEVAKNGDEAVVRLLLEYKADVNAETSDGKTALQWAVEKGHEAVVQLLEVRVPN